MSLVVSEIAEIKEESTLLKVEARLREAAAPLRRRQDEIMEVPNDNVLFFTGESPLKQLKEIVIQFGGKARKNLV